MMSFGIGLDELTSIVYGKDIFLSENCARMVDASVTHINIEVSRLFLNGMKMHSRTSMVLHIGCAHHSFGISCAANIMASGRYEPIKMRNAETNLNCIGGQYSIVLGRFPDSSAPLEA